MSGPDSNCTEKRNIRKREKEETNNIKHNKNKDQNVYFQLSFLSL